MNYNAGYVGNVIDANKNQTLYVYDSIYQQIGITSYQYDQNGQMGSFTYDCHNRLIGAETDSGEVTKYLYDAENN